MKPGTIDPNLKNQIDKKQTEIDHWWDVAMRTDHQPNKHGFNFRTFCKRRVAYLTADKWALVDRIGRM